ncbi:MAG: hypothetical protein ABI411_09835, partial [Tahibacter sp.]
MLSILSIACRRFTRSARIFTNPVRGGGFLALLTLSGMMSGANAQTRDSSGFNPNIDGTVYAQA